MSKLQSEKTRSSSSESDPRYANIDERKRKRMISNRESARRSRMRKQKQLESLTNEIGNIQRQNAELRQSVDLTSQKYMEMESANNVLRARAMELAARLRSVNTVLEIVDAVGGYDVEIQDVPDPLHEPWMTSCQIAPIGTSADTLLY